MPCHKNDPKIEQNSGNDKTDGSRTEDDASKNDRTDDIKEDR